MRFRLVCISADRLPMTIVSTAMAESNRAADSGSRKAAFSRNAKAAALVLVAMKVVTGVALPW